MHRLLCERIEGLAYGEIRLVPLLGLVSVLRERCIRGLLAAGESRYGFLNFLVAFTDVLLIDIVEFDCLSQCKDVLIPVVPGKGGNKRRSWLLATYVPMDGEHFRAPLTGNDLPDDPHARGPRYIGYHVMELNVHLHESFLHVPDMGRGVLDEPFPVTKVGPEAGDVLTGAGLALKSPNWCSFWSH